MDHEARRPETHPTAEEEVTATTFGVNTSIRYHQKRRAFFSLMHRVTIGAAMVVSSAAFAALSLGESLPWVARWIALGVAALTAFDWVIGYSEMARLHDQLYRRFSKLAAEIVAVVDPSIEQVRKWRREELLIEADEPSQLRVLTRVCHNEEAQAQGYEEEYIHPVGFFQRLFMHFFSVPGIDRRRAAE